MLVCALGDLMLDVVVRSDTGLVAGGDVPVVTRLLPGGQAANVCAWVADLGASARFLGKRGDDPAGRLAGEELMARGVEVTGPVVPGRGGIVVSFVAADGERSMASDRGVAAELTADEIRGDWLVCDHLHVSGYSLAAESQRRAVEHAVRAARDHGARVSVDIAAATIVEAIGQTPFRALLQVLAPDLVFCNEDEERAVGGPLEGPTWIVKLGARGARVAGEHFDAVTVPRVVDATGAGDAFAAGWIVGGTGLALETAARCVQQIGAMPHRGCG